MRSVVVTGGGTGIGKAIAAAFAAEGNDVLVTGRRPDVLHKAAAELGTRAFVGDMTDPAQVDRLVGELGGNDGIAGNDGSHGIDVLVNCAGGNTDFDRPAPDGLAELAAAWRANLEANLVSAVLVTTALAPHLNDGGAVVHIGSIAADKGAGAYGAAKAGLASWNVDLATDLGQRDITSNVVAPGYVASTEFFRDRLSDERRAGLVAAARTGRASAPADIASAVVFLASAGARQITGQVINVNGGERTTR